MLLCAYIVCLCVCAGMNVCAYVYICKIMLYVHNHVREIWSYVCACMLVSSGVEVYVYIHLRIGLYVCLYNNNNNGYF